MNARETASYWVEYVIRHRGAPHLRYPGADLNFWQYNSIDVVVFLITVLYVAFKFLAVFFKFLVSKCWKSSKKSEKKKPKTN